GSNSGQTRSVHQQRWPCGQTQASFSSSKQRVNGGRSRRVSRPAPCRCRTPKRGLVVPAGSYTSAGLPAISTVAQVPLMTPIIWRFSSFASPVVRATHASSPQAQQAAPTLDRANRSRFQRVVWVRRAGFGFSETPGGRRSIIGRDNADVLGGI